MEVFLRKNILPKLAMCMQEFPISPHQQVLGRSIESYCLRSVAFEKSAVYNFALRKEIGHF